MPQNLSRGIRSQQSLLLRTGRRARGRGTLWTGCCVALGVVCAGLEGPFERSASAGELFRNGAGAKSMALGGVSVASPESPLDAASSNPAGFALVDGRRAEAGVWGAIADGETTTRSGFRASPEGALGIAPELGASTLLGSGRVGIGIGVLPDAAKLEWRFPDEAGGLEGGTSYGPRRHQAEILLVRTAAGVGVRVTDTLHLGAAVGVVYNRNSLEAPYTFQSHPAIRGFKTLLDLEAEGWGVYGTMGAVFRPNESLSFGLSYRTPTRLETEGSAAGDAGVQLTRLGEPFASVPPGFRYDARVTTELPDALEAGVSWQACSRVRVVGQVEWVRWSEAFDRLDITLTGGNNAPLNALLGTDRLDDTAPLDWSDRVVLRAGIEVMATEALLVRAGYAFGEGAIPDSTLTPMNAAILEHTLSAGAEWRWKRFTVALAYQYDLPVDRDVEGSGLRSGEFSGSRIELQAHRFAVTTGFSF